MNLEGKVAIITGGSKGIGRAIAIDLAKQGVHPVLVARTEADLMKTAEEINALPEARAHGVNSTFYAADVTDIERMKEVFSSTYAFYSRLDMLVNNAGTFRIMHIRDMPVEKLAQTLNVNLMGPVIATKLALKYMESTHKKTGDRGIILDVLSTAADAANRLDQNHTYGVSKVGHEDWSKRVEMEYSATNTNDPKIVDIVEVFRIYPSNVKTPGWANIPDSELSATERMIKQAPKLEPEEVAKVATKLISGGFENREILVKKEDDKETVGVYRISSVRKTDYHKEN